MKGGSGALSGNAPEINMKRRVNTALALVLAASMVAGPQVLAAEDGISINAVSEDEVQSDNAKDEKLLLAGDEDEDSLTFEPQIDRENGDVLLKYVGSESAIDKFIGKTNGKSVSAIINYTNVFGANRSEKHYGKLVENGVLIYSRFFEFDTEYTIDIDTYETVVDYDFYAEAITKSECIDLEINDAKGKGYYKIKTDNVDYYLRAILASDIYLNGDKYKNFEFTRTDTANKLVYFAVQKNDIHDGVNILKICSGKYSVYYATGIAEFFSDEPEIDYSTGNVIQKFDCDKELEDVYKNKDASIYLNDDINEIKPHFTEDGICIDKSYMVDGDGEYAIRHVDGDHLFDWYIINYDFYGTLLSKSSYSYEYDEDGNCVITLTPMCYSELAERSDDIIVKINDEDTEAEPILNDDDKTISFKVSKDFINDKTNDADLCLGEDSLHFEIEPEEKPSVIKLVHAWGRDIALDQDGNRVSGFVEVSGNKYYANKKGEVYKNKTILIDGKYYGFDANGVIRSAGFVNGWDKLYYYDENGVRITDELFEVNGKKYYADENGVLAVNKTVEIDGVKYRFGKDGAMVEK